LVGEKKKILNGAPGSPQKKGVEGPGKRGFAQKRKGDINSGWGLGCLFQKEKASELCGKQRGVTRGKKKEGLDLLKGTGAKICPGFLEQDKEKF